MPHFSWTGLDEEYKKAQIANMHAQIKYPEQRGKQLRFIELLSDRPAAAREKEANRKRYHAKREKDLLIDLEKRDLQASFDGKVCKKGDKIFIAEDDPRLPKMRRLVKGWANRAMGWVEVAEVKAKKE